PALSAFWILFREGRVNARSPRKSALPDHARGPALTMGYVGYFEVPIASARVACTVLPSAAVQPTEISEGNMTGAMPRVVSRGVEPSAPKRSSSWEMTSEESPKTLLSSLRTATPSCHLPLSLGGPD